MLDTLKKQKLFFISLIGIVVVSLTLTATFAYQTLTVEEKNGSNKEMTLNVGVLDVSFQKTNKIETHSMSLLDNYKTADYVEFIIDNARSTFDVAYQISLSNLEYSTNLSSEDFNYTVTEIKNNEETILSNGNFSELSKIEPFTTEFTLKLYDRTYNYINVGEKQTIRLYLWLKETTDNQNYLKNTSFKGIITLTSIFKNDIPITLSEKIIENSKTGNGITTTKYQTTPNSLIGTKSLESEKLLLTTLDNNGTSYYYRGNVLDNYINLEGMCFRIVRILGNRNIKLVLVDENNECNSKLITNNNSLIGGYTNEFNYTNLYQNLTKWINGETIITDNTNTTYIPKTNLNNNKNIIEEKWCTDIEKDTTYTCEKEELRKVGVLTLNEIINAGSSLNEDLYSYYLITNTTGEYMTNNSKINVKTNGGIENIESEKMIGIRPSIVIDKDVIYASGSGTIDNPYVIY